MRCHKKTAAECNIQFDMDFFGTDEFNASIGIRECCLFYFVCIASSPCPTVEPNYRCKYINGVLKALRFQARQAASATATATATATAIATATVSAVNDLSRDFPKLFTPACTADEVLVRLSNLRIGG